MPIVQPPTVEPQSESIGRNRYPGYTVRIGSDSDSLVKIEEQKGRLKRLHFDVYLVPARSEFVIRHRANATQEDREWAERWAEGAHSRWDRDAGPHASIRRASDGTAYWVSLLGQYVNAAHVPASVETVDDLAYVAKELGVEVSRIVPPRWATDTDYTPGERMLQHTAEAQFGAFRVSMLRDIYAPKDGPFEVSDDAVISWTVEHGAGIHSDEYEFTIAPDQIDGLVTALLTIREEMRPEDGRPLRRPRAVDERLLSLDG